MAKHHRAIPFVAALVVMCVCLCDAGRVLLDQDDYRGNFTGCQLLLDEAAPKCWNDVYFTKFLPENHTQCCNNYLKMDKERHDCWFYLFDDPTSTMALETNLARCKLELEPPSSDNRKRTSAECKSDINGEAPNCWEAVYYKHSLPKRKRRRCCSNLLGMDQQEPICFAYLFDDPKSTFALRKALNKCGKEVAMNK